MAGPRRIEGAAIVLLTVWVAVAAREVSLLDRAVVAGSTATLLLAGHRFEAQLYCSPALSLLRPAASQGLCLGTALPACAGLAIGSLCVHQGTVYGHRLADAAAAAAVMAAVVCVSLATLGPTTASTAAAAAGSVFLLSVSSGGALWLVFPAALASSWLAALRLSPRSFTLGESLCVSSLLATLVHPCTAALAGAAQRGLAQAGVSGTGTSLLHGCAPSAETDAQFSDRAALCAVALVSSGCASVALVLATLRGGGGGGGCERGRRSPSDPVHAPRIAALLGSRGGAAAKAVVAVCLPAAGIALPTLTAALGCNPVLWVTGSLVAHPPRLATVAAWAAVLAGAVPCAGQAAARGAAAQILLRKLFHALVVLLFLPGTIAQPLLQCLAYAVGAAGLLVAECVRLGAGRSTSTGATLERFVAPLRDARDAGPLLLTPLYLLLGCALPAWAAWAAGLFDPRRADAGEGADAYAARALAGSVLGTAGVLVLGVGDAAAAAAGKAVGRIRWPGGRKTVEGSLCGVAATAAAGAACVAAQSALLAGTGASAGGVRLGHGAAVGLGIGLVGAFAVEAATDQIDNLVMPMYAAAAVAAGLRPG